MNTPTETDYYDSSKIALEGLGDFFESKHLVRDQISLIISQLAPISATECFSLIRTHWGYKRIGNQIQTFLEECASDFYSTKSEKEVFFWISKEQEDEICQLRLPANGLKRHPKTIAPQELMNGIYLIVKQNHEVDKKEVYRAVSKKLGISSLSKESEEYFEEATVALAKKNYITHSDSKIFLVTN